MRYLLCALVFGCSLLAQDQTSTLQKSAGARGAFYVDGIVYQYAAGREFTVVVAAHPLLNHKFVGVKVRVYNGGQHSVTVKPEEVVVEDAVAGRAVAAVSGAELAQRMRKPYNIARYSVGGTGVDAQPITSDMVSPQMLEMMRALAARANGGAMPSGSNVLYTDTPGALDEEDQPARPVECDQVCRLRARETQGADPLMQLQRQTAPDTVEQYAFLANTVPPRGNVAGVLFYPLGKLAERTTSAGKKARAIRMTVPVGGESFQFEMVVE